MGDYSKAEPLCHQAIEITKVALGENHPDYARTMSNLAMMYESMERYAEAEPLQKKSIEILPDPIWI